MAGVRPHAHATHSCVPAVTGEPCPPGPRWDPGARRRVGAGPPARHLDEPVRRQGGCGPQRGGTASQGEGLTAGALARATSSLEGHDGASGSSRSTVEPPPAADPLLPGVWDTQRGFKLFRGPVARQLFAQLHTTGFAFDVKVPYLARRSGHRVREVPVRWINSPSSRVSPLRDARAMALDLLRIRFTR